MAQGIREALEYVDEDNSVEALEQFTVEELDDMSNADAIAVAEKLNELIARLRVQTTKDSDGNVTGYAVNVHTSS